MPPMKVLCPVDFSDPSWEALESSAWLARRLDGELTVLHVLSAILVPLPEGGVMASPAAMQEHLDKAQAVLEEWRKRAEQLAAAKVEVVTEIGEPAATIDAFARRHGFDLIVMGTHGRTGLAHVLVGSVAEKVVRTAPCAVMTVKVPDGEKGTHAFERQRVEAAT